MIIRSRLFDNIVATSMGLAALAACGNNGAPPYAPEAQQTAAAKAAAITSAATVANTMSAATATAPAITPAAAFDPHVLYDLREKCGADARQWYQHFYEESGVNPKRSTVNHGFSSHYDAKRNDCFALTSSISGIPEIKSKKTRIVEVQNLASVLENKEIGSLVYEAGSPGPADCHVAEKSCKSREEWESLTSPYMND